MKLTRSIMVVLVGISLSAPSAHACELPGVDFFTWVYRICHPDSDSSPKQSNQGRSPGRDCHGGGGTPVSAPTPPSLPKS